LANRAEYICLPVKLMSDLSALYMERKKPQPISAAMQRYRLI
jgi:hypothetical protein